MAFDREVRKRVGGHGSADTCPTPGPQATARTPGAVASCSTRCSQGLEAELTAAVVRAWPGRCATSTRRRRARSCTSIFASSSSRVDLPDRLAAVVRTDARGRPTNRAEVGEFVSRDARLAEPRLARGSAPFPAYRSRASPGTENALSIAWEQGAVSSSTVQRLTTNGILG